VTDISILNERIVTGKTVLCFYANWFKPVRKIISLLNKLSKRNANVKFLLVDIEESEKIAEDFFLSGLVSFFLYENNVQKMDYIGTKKRDIINLVNEFANQ
jgi:thiol-disulfide isomerase/thioredoxin